MLDKPTVEAVKERLAVLRAEASEQLKEIGMYFYRQQCSLIC